MEQLNSDTILSRIRTSKLELLYVDYKGRQIECWAIPTRTVDEGVLFMLSDGEYEVKP